MPKKVPEEIAFLQAKKERFLIVINDERDTYMDSRGSLQEVWGMLEHLKEHLDSRFPEMFGFYHKPFEED